MIGAELQPGMEYAFREKRSTTCPLQRIRLIEHIRGNKWKAKWVDPNPGLIDYVTTAQIIVPWREKKDFLRDEVNLAAMYEHNGAQGYKFDSPVTLAIEQIFESAGDGARVSRGILSGTPDQVNRISSRAGCSEYELERPAYLDRMGLLQLPFDQAFELGRKLCTAEPSTVLTDIEATERKWTSQAARPGGEYIIPLLNSYRASWALLRQWGGLDAAVAARDEQIRSLERLVWDAVYALQKAGLDSEASKLRRAIGDR